MYYEDSKSSGNVQGQHRRRVQKSVQATRPERAKCGKCQQWHRTARAAARCWWPYAEGIYGDYPAAPAFAVTTAVYHRVHLRDGVSCVVNVELYRDLDGALDAIRWHGNGGFDGIVRHADLFEWEDGEWCEV